MCSFVDRAHERTTTMRHLHSTGFPQPAVLVDTEGDTSQRKSVDIGYLNTGQKSAAYQRTGRRPTDTGWRPAHAPGRGDAGLPDVTHLDHAWLAEARSVGLSSGASVPELLVEQVVERLANSASTRSDSSAPRPRTSPSPCPAAWRRRVRRPTPHRRPSSTRSTAGPTTRQEGVACPLGWGPARRPRWIAWPPGWPKTSPSRYQAAEQSWSSPVPNAGRGSRRPQWEEDAAPTDPD